MAYYLILTVFPLIVIAANVFPYLNIDTTDLLKFMNEHLPSSLCTCGQRCSGYLLDTFWTVVRVASLTGFWTMIKSLSSLQKALTRYMVLQNTVMSLLVTLSVVS
ncbi:MAG: YhjD/YihY/BrkB family envelope integrity protein [Streptococcus salivarius]